MLLIAYGKVQLLDFQRKAFIIAGISNLLIFYVDSSDIPDWILTWVLETITLRILE